MSMPDMPCPLGWALPPDGCCWPQVTLANKKSEINTASRYRIVNPPRSQFVLTLPQLGCFCKFSVVTGITEVIIADDDGCVGREE